MDTTVFQRFQENLRIQRDNLTSWLSLTPAWKRKQRLGPVSEESIQAHLQVLDTAIEKTVDQTLGLCDICHEHVETGLLEMDYASCVCLEHLGSEEMRRLEDELELSVKVQQALLPQQIPVIPGLRLAAFSRPAAYVGGDYFDFHRFQNGAYGLVIGDAVGHGLSASLLMASLQASLRILVADCDSPAEVMRRVNLLFYHNIRMTNFVTLFLAAYDPNSSRLVYANAGHNPALLFHPQARGSERFTWLEPTGAAIGLVEAVDFGENSVAIRDGDVLVLYTDGVTEAMNPRNEEFSQERLAELVERNSQAAPQDLVREVRQGVQEFCQGKPMEDDFTLLAGRFGPAV